MQNHQVAWHLKLFGRAACKPLAEDQRITDQTTTIRNDVTCPRCAELVKQQWGELMARQPERTEEQVIESPIYTRAVDKLAKSSVPLTGAGEVELSTTSGFKSPLLDQNAQLG